MTITTNTTDRKALVKAIAEELGTTSTYLRAPTYGYQIGDFTVDRDGNIIGEDFTALQDFLRRNGYVNDEPAADQEAVTEAQPDEEVHADSKAEPITQMDISIPARNAAVAQLKNLIFMLEDLTSLLDDSRAVAELTGFDFRDGKVSMTFPFDETQPERWTTYANLLNRIYDAAMKAIRVFPDRVEPDDQNEKYLAHVWLQRLGYHGADFKAERKILLGHLKGYCAFGSGDKMQAHKEKYTAIRRERRLAEQEAAVLEVMVEEATDNE